MTAHYVSPFCEKGDYSKKIITTAGPRLVWDLKMISLQQEILIHPDYKISLQLAKVKKYEQLGPGLKTCFSTADLSVHTAFTIAGVHCMWLIVRAGPSLHCDSMRKQLWSAISISVWQYVIDCPSRSIPEMPYACCWDIKQLRNNQLGEHHVLIGFEAGLPVCVLPFSVDENLFFCVYVYILDSQIL